MLPLRSTLALSVAFALCAAQLSSDDSSVEELLRTPAPVDDGELQVLGGLAELECAACHSTIAEEWATTRHAHAWEHERYQDAVSSKRRPQSCWGCHIPQPLHLGDLGKKPRPRTEEDEALHFGVSCASCHLGPEGKILGPFGAQTDAHPSALGESFTSPTASNQLCIACHKTTIGPVIGIAKDFELSGQAEKGLSCVGCHMAAVERPMASVDGTPSEVRAGRSHRLQTPRDPYFLALGFAVTIERQADELAVRLRNRAGHRIPGLVDRVISFTARSVDADGEILEQAQLELTTRTYLAVDASQELRLPASGAVGVQLTGTHSLPGVKTPVIFLELEREL